MNDFVEKMNDFVEKMNDFVEKMNDFVEDLNEPTHLQKIIYTLETLLCLPENRQENKHD